MLPMPEEAFLMIKNVLLSKYFYFSIGYALIISCIFAPFFISGNNYLNLIDLTVKTGNSLFSWVMILAYLFLTISMFLLMAYRHRVLYSIIFIILILLIITFVSSKAVLSFSFADKVSVHYAPIMMSFVTIASLLYCSRVLLGETKFYVNDITEIGIFVGFALVLDFPIFKIHIMPGAGSVSLVMLPLIIIALRKGFIKGLIADGVVFGLISCLIDGYGFVTYPLDYFVAFGGLAIIGLFRKYLLVRRPTWTNYLLLFLTALLAFFIRLMGATFDGMLLYGLDFVGSIWYNLTYIGFSAVGCMILLLLLYPVICRITVLFNRSYIEKQED